MEHILFKEAVLIHNHVLWMKYYWCEDTSAWNITHGRWETDNVKKWQNIDVAVLPITLTIMLHSIKISGFATSSSHTASIALSDTHTIRSISATFIKWSIIHEKLPLNTKSGQIDEKSMLSSAIEEPFMAKCVLMYRLSLNETNGASNNTNVSFSFNYSRSIQQTKGLFSYQCENLVIGYCFCAYTQLI